MPGEGRGQRGEPGAFPKFVAPHLRSLTRHEPQLTYDCGSGNPVFGHSSVVLEVEQSPQGVRSEDPIDVTGIEPDGVQTPLQLGDVIAVEHRHPVIELSIAQHESGIDQSAPRLAPDQSIDGQTLRLLEEPNGGLGARSEIAGGVGIGTEFQRGKPVLDVPDRLSLISTSIEHHIDAMLPQVPRLVAGSFAWLRGIFVGAAGLGQTFADSRQSLEGPTLGG